MHFHTQKSWIRFAANRSPFVRFQIRSFESNLRVWPLFCSPFLSLEFRLPTHLGFSSFSSPASPLPCVWFEILGQDSIDYWSATNGRTDGQTDVQIFWSGLWSATCVDAQQGKRPSTKSRRWNKMQNNANFTKVARKIDCISKRCLTWFVFVILCFYLRRSCFLTMSWSNKHFPLNDCDLQIAILPSPLKIGKEEWSPLCVCV